MVDSTGSIGSTGQSGSVVNTRETVRRDSHASRGITSGSGNPYGATPNGPRGRRMLSPETPLESLDRSAPRGTYLDIVA